MADLALGNRIRMELLAAAGRRCHGQRSDSSVVKDPLKLEVLKVDDVKKLVPEGIEGRLPFKGTVAEAMVQYIGGLRAGMGYVGAKDITALKQATMVKMSAAGIHESHPHNITITKEAPNYTR